MCLSLRNGDCLSNSLIFGILRCARRGRRWGCSLIAVRLLLVLIRPVIENVSDASKARVENEMRHVHTDSQLLSLAHIQEEPYLLSTKLIKINEFRQKLIRLIDWITRLAPRRLGCPCRTLACVHRSGSRARKRDLESMQAFSRSTRVSSHWSALAVPQTYAIKTIPERRRLI